MLLSLWPHGPPCTGGCPWDYAQPLHRTGGIGSKVSWHGAGVSSGTSAGTLHPCTWVTLSLTASLVSLPAPDDVATNLFAFPGHGTWSSAPPVFPKACTNFAPFGAATCECDDCAGPGTGERKPGSPWIPLADPLCPGRNGAALRPLLPQGCVTVLPALLPLFTPSSVWHSWSVSAPPARQQYPSAAWLLKEQLVSQAGTGTPQSLWRGETAS